MKFTKRPRPVDTLQGGEYFRKRTGKVVYLKLSEGGAKALGLNPKDHYGVNFHGNTVKLDASKLVIKMDGFDEIEDKDVINEPDEHTKKYYYCMTLKTFDRWMEEEREDYGYAEPDIRAFYGNISTFWYNQPAKFEHPKWEAPLEATHVWYKTV